MSSRFNLNYYGYLFKKEVILNGLKYSLLGYMFILFIELLIVYNAYNNINAKLYSRVISTIEREGFDIELICNLTECLMVQTADTVYVKEDKALIKENVLLPETYTSLKLTKSLDYVLEFDNFSILINNTNNLNIILDLYKYNTLLYVLLFVFIFTRLTINSHILADIEKSYYKLNLESGLQRDMTESLHHEMGVPVSLLKTMIIELYANMYPCKKSSNKICDLYCNNTIDETKLSCGDCKYAKYNRKYDIIAKDFFKEFEFCIDRLFAIMEQTKNTKQIKNSNGTISIQSILENIISTNNNFRVNKLSAIHSNKDVTNMYAVGVGLRNGDLLNVINAHITNSVEAKATEITFKARVIKNNKFLEIFIVDNGRGIRNKLGNIISKEEQEDIFLYGYSNKDQFGEQIVKSKLQLFISTFFGEPNQLRGTGLHVNRGIVRRAKGDIELIETGVNGSIFKITIPIKLRKD